MQAIFSILPLDLQLAILEHLLDPRDTVSIGMVRILMMHIYEYSEVEFLSLDLQITVRGLSRAYTVVHCTTQNVHDSWNISPHL